MNSAVVPGLIDTGVMLALFGGHPAATHFFVAMNKLGRLRFSRLTTMELLFACRSDADRAQVLSRLVHMSTEELTDVIARRAGDIITTIPLPSNLTPSDALVAATALELSLPLYTLDPARFAAVPGLTILRPY